MNLFLTGLLLVVAAFAVVVLGVFGDRGQRVPKDRRRAPGVVDAPSVRADAWNQVVTRLDPGRRPRGWSFLTAEELELADVRRPVGSAHALVGLAAFAGLLVGPLLLGSLWWGILLVLATPVVVKVWLRLRTKRRRKAFAGQLDQTLRIIASALRAGQSLPIAMGSVALDAEEPMRQELGRVVNEARVGRDLVAALIDTADRMRSEDLRWFAEAVEVQRDTGGNLNDIIDTVAETIRDRAEIREKVNAYASEGKASAFVLMALPVGLAIAYSLMNPGYLAPLLTTVIGVLLLIGSAVMYVVAFFWMRAIVNIKV